VIERILPRAGPWARQKAAAPFPSSIFQLAEPPMTPLEKTPLAGGVMSVAVNIGYIHP